MRAESSKALWVSRTRHLQRRTSLLARYEGTGTEACGGPHRSVLSARAGGLAFEDAGPAWVVVSTVEPPGENECLAWSSLVGGV